MNAAFQTLHIVILEADVCTSSGNKMQTRMKKAGVDKAFEGTTLAIGGPMSQIAEGLELIRDAG